MIDSPLIFLHIPKTGGMTLAAMIARQFPSRAVRRLNGSLAAAKAAIAALSEDDRNEIRCIYGHVAFGLHECLPAPAVYVTLVRDPVERLVSIYYYACRRPEWGLHREIAENRLSLADFVVSEAANEFHDQQTRMLGGSDVWPCGGTELALAERNLSERFAVAAPLERFDEAALLCGRLFGWKDVRYARANVNRRRPALCKISRAVIEMIEKKNVLDRELHAAVCRKFAERIAGDERLAADLAAFRRSNAWYRFVGPVSRIRQHSGR